MFDACICKCLSAGISDRNQYRGKFSCKIPAVEWDFWVGQNTSRKCIIGKVDMPTKSKLVRKEKRKCNKLKNAQLEMADEYYDGDDDEITGTC